MGQLAVTLILHGFIKKYKIEARFFCFGFMLFPRVPFYVIQGRKILPVVPKGKKKKFSHMLRNLCRPPLLNLLRFSNLDSCLQDDELGKLCSV